MDNKKRAVRQQCHSVMSCHTGRCRVVRSVVCVARQKISPTVTDLLKKLIRSNNAVGISKDWVMAGRPCSPRLLFVFEGCRLPQQVEDSAAGSRSHRQVKPYFSLQVHMMANHGNHGTPRKVWEWK